MPYVGAAHLVVFVRVQQQMMLEIPFTSDSWTGIMLVKSYVIYLLKIIANGFSGSAGVLFSFSPNKLNCANEED